MKKFTKRKDKFTNSISEYKNSRWRIHYFYFYCDICGVKHPEVCVNELCEEEGFPDGDYCWNCQRSLREQGFVGKDKTKYFWRDEFKEGQLNNNSYRIKLENILAPNKVHYISLILGDITKIVADVIVNSANKSLLAGSGVCGAIHKSAGPKLGQECQELKNELNIKFLKTGDHIVTKAYGLPAKWVIHTVGPKHNENVEHENVSLLGWCYIRPIVNADDMGAKSISFPAISTGKHNIPIKESAKIVKEALLYKLPKLLLITNVTEIKLVFNKPQDFAVYQKVFTNK